MIGANEAFCQCYYEDVLFEIEVRRICAESFAPEANIFSYFSLENDVDGQVHLKAALYFQKPTADPPGCTSS